MGTAWGLGAGADGPHLGDSLHRLCGGARGLILVEVLVRCLLLLADGGQLRLSENVFRDGPLSAAWGRAAAVIGPWLP